MEETDSSGSSGNMSRTTEKSGKGALGSGPEHVDDENSRTLFLGYATAGKRLKEQLDEQKIVDTKIRSIRSLSIFHADRGDTGLRRDSNGLCSASRSRCRLLVCCLVVASGLHNEIAVQDIGLTGKTDADGRPSAFAGLMERVLSGEVTVEDRKLLQYMKLLMDTEEDFSWSRAPPDLQVCQRWQHRRNFRSM